MPDSKITALTSISTSTDPANDPLVIVDVSDTSMAATGTTKKVTLNQLLGASGTATLASATITGDLTVDTSTLKVDSTNNRVGIGTASPSTTLTVGAASPTLRILDTNTSVAGGVYGTIDWLSSDSSMSGLAAKIDAFDDGGSYGDRAALRFFTNDTSANTEKYRIAYNGVATWSNVGGVAGTAMTLNSTGLGIGGAPAGRLSLQTTSGQTNLTLKSAGSTVGAIIGLQADGTAYFYQGDALPITFSTSGIERMRLDASGNLILASSNTPATLTINGQLTVNATSNTNLRFSYRGSDGVTRVANITLA